MNILAPTLFLLSLISTVGAAAIYRVEGFVSVTQSPFYEGIQNGSMFFNNFQLSTDLGPNLTTPTLVRLGDFSIDGDDGLVDARNEPGTLRSRSSAQPRFILNFSPDANGHYPRYFGIAFPTAVDADPFNYPVGFVPTTPAQLRGNFEVLGLKDSFNSVVFSSEIFDTASISAGFGDTRWGTFMGIYNEDGISQITLQNAYRIDHLQYGYSIPEPASASLGMLALVSCYGRRRRSLLL